MWLIRNRAKAVSGEVLQVERSGGGMALHRPGCAPVGPPWLPPVSSVAKSVLELYLMIRYEREM